MGSDLTREDIENIVRESSSIKECLQKMGRPCGAGNYRTFYRLEKLYDLDTSHFSYNWGSHLNKEGTYIPLKEYVNENKIIKGNVLLKKLIKEGYKTYKCEKCGIEDWNGEPISLQVHHIDGNHFNNNVENLMILCPNCHSQTDSFCGRGTKHKINKVCKECGRQIEKRNKSGLCVLCARKKERRVNRPNKNELLEILKNTKGNFTAVGKMFGVSDNAIRKWCKLYGLPTKSSQYKNGPVA